MWLYSDCSYIHDRCLKVAITLRDQSFSREPWADMHSLSSAAYCEPLVILQRLIRVWQKYDSELR